MDSDRLKGRLKRLILPLVLILSLVILGSWIYAEAYLDKHLGKKLQKLVAQRSNNRIDLEFNSIQLNFWRQSLQILEPSLRSTGDSPHSSHLHADVISVNDFGILSYLWNNEFSIGKVQMDSLQLTINKNELVRWNRKDSVTHGYSGRTNASIEVNLFNITDASLSVITDEGKTENRIGQLDLTVSKFHIFSAAQKRSRLFSYNSITARARNIHYRFSNGLYELNIKHWQCSTIKKSCRMDSLSFKPLLPKNAFSRRVGHETDRIGLDIRRLKLDGMDFRTLQKSGLKADKLVIGNSELHLFRNKARSGYTKTKTFPHVDLKKLDYPISLDTVNILDGNIEYAEESTLIETPGVVTFNNIRGSIYGITNNSEKISKGHTINMSLKSDLLQSAQLNLHGEFPLHKNVGYHTLWGSMGTLDMQKLNSVMEPLQLIRIKDGVIQSLKFQMELGPKVSSGKVHLQYRDLGIEVLDPKDVGETENRSFTSFLANTLKIKSKNQKPLRVGRVSSQRTFNKSIFNYWWKSLASGLKSSVGLQ